MRLPTVDPMVLEYHLFGMSPQIYTLRSGQGSPTSMWVLFKNLKWSSGKCQCHPSNKKQTNKVLQGSTHIHIMQIYPFLYSLLTLL